MKNIIIKLQTGQALITMLLFIIISVTISTAAMIVILINAKNTTKVEIADECRAVAESGIESAFLRLLRNPSYTGETFSLNGGVAVVQVNNVGSTYTMTSVTTCTNSVATVQATASIANDKITIISWKEI